MKYAPAIKTLLSKTLLSLTLLLCFANVSAKAPVWKVTKGDDHLYLGGTIHVLSKDDYPLPVAFEEAYKGSEHIWLETDVAQMTTSDAQAKMLSVIMYQDQRSLSSVLEQDTYKDLTAFLQQRQIPAAAMDKLTPAGLMLSITAMELQRLGLIDETAGVDLHFSGRAKTDGKELKHLETIDEQLSFIGKMNEIEPNSLIKSMMEEVGKTSEVWEKLLSAWKAGDMQALGDAGIKEMKAEFPLIYQTILANRNQDWMQDITQMMKSEEVEFVLVGALHMAGDDGLIKKLTKAGYTVEQLD